MQGDDFRILTVKLGETLPDIFQFFGCRGTCVRQLRKSVAQKHKAKPEAKTCFFQVEKILFFFKKLLNDFF